MFSIERNFINCLPPLSLFSTDQSQVNNRLSRDWWRNSCNKSFGWLQIFFAFRFCENGGGQPEKPPLQTTWTWLFVTWLRFFKICTSFSIMFCCSCSCSLSAIAKCWALSPGCPRAHCTGNWKEWNLQKWDWSALLKNWDEREREMIDQFLIWKKYLYVSL